MSELKLCPFCGSTDIKTESGINLIYCDNCSAEANTEHWNNRPIEDALNARIAEMEAEKNILRDQLREAKNILIDKNLQIDSLYEEGYKLHQRIAELEAEQRWIPVSERLPECEKDVLVFWGKALDGSKVDWFGTAWRNDSDDGKWCTDPIVPTHWMPLPESPIMYGKVCEE